MREMVMMFAFGESFLDFVLLSLACLLACLFDYE